MGAHTLGCHGLWLNHAGSRNLGCSLENRYPSLSGSRVQIPPPPLKVNSTQLSECTRSAGLSHRVGPDLAYLPLLHSHAGWYDLP
jgi:hypothetical protein